MPHQTVYNFQFLDVLSENQDITLNQGDTLFILGANGTGKSGLIQKFYAQNANQAKRISAHRQTWFRSNALDFTPANKVQTESNIRNYDSNHASRWQDSHHNERAKMTVFDLINAQNLRARSISDAADANNMDLVKRLTKKEAPLKQLNQLLKISNLPIEISVEADEKVFASKNGGTPYSIAELSDGERNAILIASDVLTATDNTLFIIDEPERHLHRSIISPLLTSLFQKRSDCAFVIATHDISLPLDNPEADILLVRGCEWNGNNITRWDTDLISSADEIDYQIKQDILGSRRVLLFVEGAENSLDLHIYQILFPNVSVIPQGNCKDVERAVYGISSTDTLNWVRAYGLIDADDRVQNEIDNLKNNKIYALPCYSVESIYYCPEIIGQLAAKVSELHGCNAAELIEAANDALIQAVKPHKERLCARVCERRIRQQVTMPSWQDIQTNEIFSIELDLVAKFNEEKNLFDGYISSRDVTSIISRYPVRETTALNDISGALRFSKRQDYECAVRKMLIDDEGIRSQIKAKFTDLVQAVEHEEEQTQQETEAA